MYSIPCLALPSHPPACFCRPEKGDHPDRRRCPTVATTRRVLRDTIEVGKKADYTLSSVSARVATRVLQQAQDFVGVIQETCATASFHPHIWTAPWEAMPSANKICDKARLCLTLDCAYLLDYKSHLNNKEAYERRWLSPERKRFKWSAVRTRRRCS